MHERRLARFERAIFTLLLFQNEIKVKTVCVGHRIVWKLRQNAVIMFYMIFSFSFINYQT